MSRIFDLLKSRLGPIDNPSGNPSMLQVADQRRRRMVQGVRRR